MRDIAEALKRSASTVSCEIQRNKVKSSYDPKKAHHKAYKRRKYARYQGKKIVAHIHLRAYVEEKLYDDQSPEAIAGRLRKRDRHLPYVSKDSIYRYIQSPYGRNIETHRKKKRTQRKGRRRAQKQKLRDRRFIDKRPDIINKRGRIGDAEADFIVSGKTGKGVLLTVACRKSRIAFIEQILRVTIPYVHSAFVRIKKRFPELRTITTDNDLLLQKHKELEQLLTVKIYFCHPYHSWEKGTVENTNGHIRKDIPKGSDISRYSRRFIKATEAKLNRRILKCLDHRTPDEVIAKHRKRKKRKSAL